MTATAFPQLPEAAGPREALSPAEFEHSHPLLRRHLDTAITHTFRRTHRLVSVETLPLAFFRDTRLWCFGYEESGFEQASKAIKALAFSTASAFITVDYTDSCFARAYHASAMVTDLTPPLVGAYVALYYAVSQKARATIRFHPSFRAFPRPPEIDEESWQSAVQRAESHLKSTKADDLCVSIDGRRGEIALFEPYFGRFQFRPEESSRFALVTDERLYVVREEPNLPWAIIADPGFGLTALERQTEREQQFLAAARDYRKWHPEGMEADIAVVNEEARRMYEARRRRFGWQTMVPCPDPDAAGGEAGRAGWATAVAEAEEFLAAVGDRCRDYLLPRRDVAPTAPSAATGDIQVRRRTLPFYPGHRLYQVIDRRGGRPRRTQFLFAPHSEDIPPEVDRLIPHNDASHTQHMLNAAYDIRLQDVEAVEYVDFFCDNLGGQIGFFFRVVESIDELRWRGGSEEQRRLVQEIALPIRLWPDKVEGKLVLDALLTYGGSLFHTVFHLTEGGLLEMIHDRVLHERLEIVPELVSVKTHFFLRPPNGFSAPQDWYSKAIAR